MSYHGRCSERIFSVKRGHDSYVHYTRTHHCYRAKSFTFPIQTQLRNMSDYILEFGPLEKHDSTQLYERRRGGGARERQPTAGGSIQHETTAIESCCGLSVELVRQIITLCTKSTALRGYLDLPNGLPVERASAAVYNSSKGRAAGRARPKLW